MSEAGGGREKIAGRKISKGIFNRYSASVLSSLSTLQLHESYLPFFNRIMAPKKKSKRAKIAKDDVFISLDPEELMSQSRDEMVKEMKSGKKIHEFTDLDIAIKTVRAIIVTNEEIWNRCKGYFTCYGDDSEEEESNFSIMRFDEVKVVYDDNYDHTSIVAVAKEATKYFCLEPLKVLPECLGIFEPTKDETGHVDFRMYFRRSLVLHEDVLLPFLSKLKNHLEEVQVCLGAVDEWVAGTANNVQFLKTTFEIESVTDLPLEETLCNCYRRRNYGRCNCSGSGKGYIIKTFNVPGTVVVQSFDISKEKDQLQLMRLLEFLSNA